MHKVEGVGALEVHLEPFGGVCNLLESIGGDLEHLEAKEAIWRCLEEFLKALEACKVPLLLFESS